MKTNDFTDTMNNDFENCWDCGQFDDDDEEEVKENEWHNLD